MLFVFAFKLGIFVGIIVSITKHTIISNEIKQNKIEQLRRQTGFYNKNYTLDDTYQPKK